MGSKKQKAIPGVRKVLVDIPTHDDDGNPITDDMLSSGGARDRGPIVKQYSNPQPHNPGPARTDADRASRNSLVVDGLRWAWDEFGRPWWTNRGPQDLRRVSGWVMTQARRVRKPAVDAAPGTDEEPAEVQIPPDVGAASAVPADGEHNAAKTTLAPVVSLEDYRRSA